MGSARSNQTTRRVPAAAGVLVLCVFLAAGCGEPKEPPIPPGMVRVGDRPLQINTPPLKVQPRISAPFPEEELSPADELDAALRDMGLDMDAPAPREESSRMPELPDPNNIDAPADGEASTGLVEQSSQETAGAPDVSEDLAALRSDVARMQAMLDLVLDEFVIELKNENNRLREEIEALRRELEAQELQDSDLLRLGRQAAGARLSPEQRTEDAPAPSYDEVAELDDAGPVRYAVIKEWGRSAEEAARLNGASTLKGLICAVPPDATDAQLAELGRWLRNAHANYENINIDVFDDVEAARQFAETNRMESGHRVLNISKHPATNRDVIVLIRQEGTTVIPPEAPEP